MTRHRRANQVVLENMQNTQNTSVDFINPIPIIAAAHVQLTIGLQERSQRPRPRTFLLMRTEIWVAIYKRKHINQILSRLNRLYKKLHLHHRQMQYPQMICARNRPEASTLCTSDSARLQWCARARMGLWCVDGPDGAADHKHIYSTCGGSTDRLQCHLAEPFMLCYASAIVLCSTYRKGRKKPALYYDMIWTSRWRSWNEISAQMSNLEGLSSGRPGVVIILCTFHHAWLTLSHYKFYARVRWWLHVSFVYIDV